MLLSRFWYVVLALAVGASLYVAFLATGQFNRQNTDFLSEGIAADRVNVELFLKVDARRRLDRLVIVAASLREPLKAASAEAKVPPKAKADSQAALKAAKDAFGVWTPDLVYAVDAEGRVVGAVENRKGEYEPLQTNEDLELGGYPAVFDALHGYLRDDTWLMPDAKGETFKLYLVVTRPVETELGGAPVGAVVALKEFDQAYATAIAEGTRTNVGFYAAGKILAKAAGTTGFNDGLIDQAAGELAGLPSDKGYDEKGSSELRWLGSKSKEENDLGATYTRIPGAASDQGAGFVVVRSKFTLAGPKDLLDRAQNKDKQSVPLVAIILALVGAILVGLFFTVLEHSLPVRELARQAQDIKDGKLDGLQVARFRGAYRLAAQNLNNGMERIIEKGGGAPRKAADLESILGPVPAQPAMSAFSFPMQDGAPGSVVSSGSGPAMVPMSPPSVPGRAPPSGASVGKATPAVAMSPATSPAGFNPGPMGARPGGPPPPINPPAVPSPGMLGGLQSPPTRPGAPPVPAARPPVPPPPPPPQQFTAHTGGEDAEDEEATMVAAIPAEVLAQATGERKVVDNEAGEWLSVYDDFIRTKKQCGEATDGLTFDKFQHTLKKNRDALMARHGCRRVKFSVYVKEGRASLKATPVKD